MTKGQREFKCLGSAKLCLLSIEWFCSSTHLSESSPPLATSCNWIQKSWKTLRSPSGGLHIHRELSRGSEEMCRAISSSNQACYDTFTSSLSQSHSQDWISLPSNFWEDSWDWLQRWANHVVVVGNQRSYHRAPYACLTWKQCWTTSAFINHAVYICNPQRQCTGQRETQQYACWIFIFPCDMHLVFSYITACKLMNPVNPCLFSKSITILQMG